MNQMQILEDATKITAYPKEACKGCGSCCAMYLPATKRELKRIRKYAKERGIKPVFQPIMCPWLGSDGLCKVYEVRPNICRIYDCRKHKDMSLFTSDRMMMLRDAEIVDLGEFFCSRKFEPEKEDE